MFTLRCAALVAGAVAFAQPASAWYFETRFVERVGSVDVVLPGNTIDASDGAPRDIRIQIGVFDDANGPAPAGGVLGWNNGTLTVSGAIGNSDETRTPGRLAPFTFSPFPYSNGVPAAPAGDPFTALTQIDAVRGPQTLPWLCGPDGNPLPMPQPTIRGLNTFVSTFAFTIDPNLGAVSYTVTVGGSQVVATEWRLIQSSEPDCSDPDNPIPGIADWGGFAILPTPSMTPATLNVIVPPPGAATGMLIAAAATFARRRRR